MTDVSTTREPAAPRTPQSTTHVTSVLDLLHVGVLTAQVAARLTLAQAREAMTLAESHTVTGKVVIIP